MPDRVEHWKFLPHPMLRNGHLQTVAAVYLPRRHGPYAATRHEVPVESPPADPAGHHERIVLHEDVPANFDPRRPNVLIVHGLTGCYLSPYMCRLTDRLTARGHVVFRMDMRGCGAGAEVAKQPTHCGRSEDIRAALEFVARRYPETPTYLVAFSLSGGITLNLLAEIGDGPPVGNLRRSCVVCPPIDLFAIKRRFETAGGRPYDRFFAKQLWKQILDRWDRFPDLAPLEIPGRPKRVRELDEMVIAPAAGFRNGDEYYALTQPGPRLADIHQPVTIVAAEDDPVVPVHSLREYAHGPGIEAVYIPGGGHLGFIAARNGDPDSRWMDWRIVDWVEQKWPG